MNDAILLFFIVFSFVMGGVFGFATWIINYSEEIERKDPKVIGRLSRSHVAIAGLFSGTSTAYLILEVSFHPVLSVLAGAIVAVFTRPIIKTGEKIILNFNWKVKK